MEMEMQMQQEASPDLRELDYAVAERVMDWRWWRTTLRYSTEVRRALMPAHLQNEDWRLADGTEAVFTGEHSPFVPHYSTDIAAAMEVVEAMRDRGWRVSIINNPGTVKSDLEWSVDFACSRTVNALAATLPEAICLAALALVDGKSGGEAMNNEQIEIEDDQRCGECGSTEGGNCFYCQDGLG